MEQDTFWRYFKKIHADVYGTTPAHIPAEQKREAAKNWDMAKSLRVTCQLEEGTMISKLMCMDERDKEEAQRLGIREGDTCRSYLIMLEVWGGG